MKLLKIDVQDGNGEIEVALHSHTELARLDKFVGEATNSLLSAAPTPPEVVGSTKLTEFNSGPLKDYGGGDLLIWWDYIRDLLRLAHTHYQEQVENAAPTPPEVEPVGQVTHGLTGAWGELTTQGSNLPQGANLYTSPPSPKAPEAEPFKQYIQKQVANAKWGGERMEAPTDWREVLRVLDTFTPPPPTPPDVEPVYEYHLGNGIWRECPQEEYRREKRMGVRDTRIMFPVLHNNTPSPKAAWSEPGEPLNLEAAARDLVKQFDTTQWDELNSLRILLENLRKFLGES